jgi:hypothetical protein
MDHNERVLAREDWLDPPDPADCHETCCAHAPENECDPNCPVCFEMLLDNEDIE